MTTGAPAKACPWWRPHLWTKWEMVKVAAVMEVAGRAMTGLLTKQRRTCTRCELTQQKDINV